MYLTSIALWYIMFLNIVSSEFFTAMSKMESLLEIDEILINHIRSYVANRRNQLQSWNQFVHKYERIHKATRVNISAAFEQNPIVGFQIINRLSVDWDYLNDFPHNHFGVDILKNLTTYKINATFPDNDDLHGAAIALARLQATYNLPTNEISQGMINGTMYRSEMSASDCFEMARQLHRDQYQNNHYYVVNWLLEADNINEMTKHEKDKVSEMDILEYLAESFYEQGSYVAALTVLEKIIRQDPNNELAWNRKLVLEHFIIKGTTYYGNPIPVELPLNTQYNQLCRKQYQRSFKILAPLRCRYVTKNSEFLKIAPLKLEEISLDPYMVVYHQILWETEIQTIKKIAKARFIRSIINHKSSTTAARISNTAWIPDIDDDRIKAISKRVEDMTGLKVKNAEFLQVLNYGIGGHYITHFDYFLNDVTGGSDGNRIATVIFYLTDVEQGGATVFPEINIALWPEKGSAAFWYNLHASGVRDPRTLHSACPVLVGNKWVCNKWLREVGQEFSRPCKLYPDHIKKA